MLQRMCGENWRGGRSAGELGRRRRHHSRLGPVVVWPAEPRLDELAATPNGDDLLGPACPTEEPSIDRQVPRDRLRPRPRPPELFGNGLARLPVQPIPVPAPRQAGPAESLTWLWQLLGQPSAAGEEWSELLRLAVASAETPARAEALNAIGWFASAAGDLTTAQAFFHEALIAGRASQCPAEVARSLSGLVKVAVGRGAFDLARTLQQEALAIHRRLGDSAEVARSLAILGWLVLESYGAQPAESLHEEALTLRVTAGEPLALAYSLVHLGWLAQLSGRQDAARQHLAEALGTVRHSPERWKIVALLALLGRPSLGETPVRRAIGLLAGAEALEASVEPGELTSAPFVQPVAARSCLDARSLALAWSGGPDADALGLIERTLQAADVHRQTARQRTNGVAEPMPLTARELEVAVLIGRGLTNRRIADELVIAERTAETHARNIREKLGLATRAQIAAWAAVHVRPE